MKAEYIWMDGTQPTKRLRSKTKIIEKASWLERKSEFPRWGFDGSSTGQASGHQSDCLLRPVYHCPDPVRGGDHVLVLCEVYDFNDHPDATNTRAQLREGLERYAADEPLFGIEQEYTMFRGMRPLGWPEGGYPAPQGPFYCGVGADEVFGREVVEQHLEACLAAGLTISGVNAEVMPGQWEFQVGPEDALAACDQLMIARWLLFRIGEDHGVSLSLDPKPVRGDWNGAGAHTNFSTKAMREKGGIAVIEAACEKLKARHDLHIENYGEGIERRLTGLHETCSHSEFQSGVGHRGASIRIPLQVAQDGCGYLEDRRPCANMDPYVVTRLLMETVCDEGREPKAG